VRPAGERVLDTGNVVAQGRAVNSLFNGN